MKIQSSESGSRQVVACKLELQHEKTTSINFNQRCHSKISVQNKTVKSSNVPVQRNIIKSVVKIRIKVDNVYKYNYWHNTIA